MATVDGTDRADRIDPLATSRGVQGTPGDGEDVITGRLGNDRIEAGDGTDWVYADRSGSAGFGRSANDLVLGQGGDDLIFGDAEVLGGSVRGGRDLLDGGEGKDTLLGDAAVVWERARGGADRLQGGAGADLLYGDGRELREGARGGADTLLGGEGPDQLFGDALFVDATASPGRDRLAGEAGDDLLFGGGGDDDLLGGDGADLFVLGPAPGLTRILDLERGTDALDVALLGLDFARLDGDDDGRIDAADPFVTASGGGLRLDLGAAAGGPAGSVLVLVLGTEELGPTEVRAGFALPAG